MENILGVDLGSGTRVYNDKIYRTEWLKKYFTEYGIIVLENKLKSLSQLYAKNIKYPFKATCLGFPPLVIYSKEHHEGMIEELCQILGIENVKIKVKS